MRPTLSILPRSLALMIALSLLGCGDGGKAGPETVPVSGTILMDGKPLADADVNFTVEGFGAVGKTNAEGKYELVQGAVPGENIVYISKWEGGDIAINPEEGMDAGQFEAMQDPAAPGGAATPPSGPKQLIPARFSDPKPGIKFTVPEGGTDSADFKIQSE